MSDETIRIELRVTNEQGLHVRAASQLAKLAGRFECRIELLKGDQRVNAKSIIEILTLSAAMGTELVLEAKGRDAEEAVREAAELFRSGFSDPRGDADLPQQ